MPSAASAGRNIGEPIHVYDGLDPIGSVSEGGDGFAALDADDGYLGTFEHRIDAIRALRTAWQLRRVRVGVAR